MDAFLKGDFTLNCSLQSQYVEHSDAVLLVVIPASQAPEVSSYKALRIAKENDGECKFQFLAFQFVGHILEFLVTIVFL